MQSIRNSSHEVLMYVASLIGEEVMSRDVSFVQKGKEVWVWFEDDHTISLVEGESANKPLQDYRDGDILVFTHRL